MSKALLSLADPLLTASIYCADRLDEVIYRCIAPFWQSFGAHDPERQAFMWLIRYPRGGEHLKVRIHAPEEMRSRLRSSLETAATEYLATLREAEPALGQPRRNNAPPIDVEDESPEGYPDRSFLWTRYRRSHVSFGGGPFLEDDQYIARFTRCLGAGCEKALTAVQPDPQGNVPFRARQNTLVKANISALAGLGWSTERRSSYLAYHRDWLLRFVLSQSHAGPDVADEMLARFDANLKALGSALETLQKHADAQWSRPEATTPSTSDLADPLRAAAGELVRYVAPFADKPDYTMDPFAPELTFSPLFKALHGFANQLGLKFSDESFAHHLLLRLSAGEERYGFTHEPIPS